MALFVELFAANRTFVDGGLAQANLQSGLMAERSINNQLAQDSQYGLLMEAYRYTQGNWGWDERGGLRADFSNAPKSEPDRKAIERIGVALADESDAETQLAREAESLFGYNVLRRKLKIPGKLGEILAMLDIEPLDFAAVEKYKSDTVLWRQKQLAETGTADARYYVEIGWRRGSLESCNQAGTEIPLFALRKAIQVKKACPEAILEVDELIEQKKLIDPFLVARLDDETYYLEVWKEPKFEETL